MGKMRGLMDRMTHKDHDSEKQDEPISDEVANSFMHKTSRDTGFATTEKREGGSGKAVY
jgi:hypothetical protein